VGWLTLPLLLVLSLLSWFCLCSCCCSCSVILSAAKDPRHGSAVLVPYKVTSGCPILPPSFGGGWGS
jgi:hypothetical protein